MKRVPDAVYRSVDIKVYENVGRCLVAVILADMCLQADTGKPFFAGVVASDLDLCGLALRIEQVDAGDLLVNIIEFVSDKDAFLTAQGKINADVDNDGSITMEDNTALLQIIAKLR